VISIELLEGKFMPQYNYSIFDEPNREENRGNSAQPAKRGTNTCFAGFTFLPEAYVKRRRGRTHY